MDVIFAARVGNGYKVRGVTPDAVSKIDAYYRKHPESEGWTQDEDQMSLDLAESKAYQYEKGDKILVVKIVANETETTIEMTYMAGAMM